MSGNIRRKTTSPRIGGKEKKEKEAQGCSSEQYPWISFRYMTANKDHSLAFLEGLEVRDRECTQKHLISRLEELSRHPWSDWINMRKRNGLETLSADELTFSPAQDAPVTKDMTMYIFRFDTYQGIGKGRIIGFKLSPCAAYHIIGYDFDFSAYDH